MDVGVGVGDITPHGSVPMDGYAARTASSVGVRDPLRAYCFVFQANSGLRDESSALVILDALGASSACVRALRHLVASETGIPPDRVFVSATHTHAGPAGIADGELDPCLLRDEEGAVGTALRAGVRQAARQAGTHLFRARIGFGRIPVQSVAAHRTVEARAVDDSLWLMRVDDTKGQMRAVLANYPCHSTLLGPANRHLSGDLLGVAAKRAEADGPSDVTVAITYGAAGDISTRFTRRVQRDQELERMAGMLAAELLELAGRVRTRPSSVLRCMGRSCEIAVRDPAAAKAAIAELAGMPSPLVDWHGEPPSAAWRVHESRLEGLRALAGLLDSGTLERESMTLQIGGLRIGDGYLITIPGEPFNELVRSIRTKAVPPQEVAVLACTNGYVGYFPDLEAVEGGWYEAQNSRFDQRALAKLTEVGAELFLALRGGENG